MRAFFITRHIDFFEVSFFELLLVSLNQLVEHLVFFQTNVDDTSRSHDEGFLGALVKLKAKATE